MPRQARDPLVGEERLVTLKANLCISDPTMFDVVHLEKKEMTETLKMLAELKALFCHTFFFSFFFLCFYLFKSFSCILLVLVYLGSPFGF
jgi:hypothetical protein